MFYLAIFRQLSPEGAYRPAKEPYAKPWNWTTT